MFSRIATLAVLVAVAAAAPGTRSTDCSTGTQMCCNSSQYTSGFGLSSLTAGSLISLLDGTSAQAGLTCDPITVIGALTGSSCTQQTACCVNTSSTGLVNFSCNNINL